MTNKKEEDIRSERFGFSNEEGLKVTPPKKKKKKKKDE